MPVGTKRIIRRAPKAASRYEEEEPEEEPRPRRRRDDDEEEDERPRSRRRARDEDEDEDDGRSRSRSRRRRDDDDDEDDVDEDELLATGWSGANRIKKESPSDFAQDFAVPDEPTIIKFLEAEPVTSYHQHWCDWLPAGQKLSHVCIKADCPVCDVGDKPQGRYCFNILDFTDPKHPQPAVWKVGIKVSNLIEKLSKQPKSGPLDRPDLYFEVYKSGGGGGKRSGGRVQTNLNAVKARDLQEDYDIKPLSDDQLEAFQKKTYKPKDIIQVTPRKELERIADALED